MSVDEATPAKVIDNALTNIEKEASLLMKETTSNPKDISEGWNFEFFDYLSCTVCPSIH